MAQAVKRRYHGNAEDTDVGPIPSSRRSPGGGSGNPLQYSIPGSPMDRGAWWATVDGVAESQTPPSTRASAPAVLLVVDCPTD